jgi:hypothetical protein
MSGALQAVYQNLRSFGGGGWLTISSATPAVFLGAITKDSANKTYVVGSINGPSSTRQFNIVRFTTTGTADLNVSLTSSTGGFGFTGYDGISVDTSGNVYAFMSSNATNAIQMVKWNSSGTVQFQNRTSTSSATEIYPFQSAIDSSGNVYLTPYFYYATGGCCGVTYFSPAIIKYNSSGAIVWSNYYYYTTNPSYSEGIALDGSGNVWVVGTNIIVKTNSSGTATIIKTSGNSRFYKIAIDSSSNVYIAGKENTGTNSTLHSVSSTATINWSRKFVIGTTMDNSTTNVTTDSSGNIYYVINVATTASPTGIVILKYNSSGTLQWQRQLTTGLTSSTPLVSQDITIVNNQVNITGYGVQTIGGAYIGFTISVPTDGSGTGTIVVGGISYVYAVSSGTDSAGAAVTLTTQTNSTTALGASNTATTHSSLTNQLTNTTTTF